MDHLPVLVVSCLGLTLTALCVILVWRLTRCIRTPAVLDPASAAEQRRQAEDALVQRLLDDLREHTRPSGGRLNLHDVEVLLGRRRTRGQ